jgi:hypothetical protein
VTTPLSAPMQTKQSSYFNLQDDYNASSIQKDKSRYITMYSMHTDWVTNEFIIEINISFDNNMIGFLKNNRKLQIPVRIL